MMRISCCSIFSLLLRISAFVIMIISVSIGGGAHHKFCEHSSEWTYSLDMEAETYTYIVQKALCDTEGVFIGFCIAISLVPAILTVIGIFKKFSPCARSYDALINLFTATIVVNTAIIYILVVAASLGIIPASRELARHIQKTEANFHKGCSSHHQDHIIPLHPHRRSLGSTGDGPEAFEERLPIIPSYEEQKDRFVSAGIAIAAGCIYFITAFMIPCSCNYDSEEPKAVRPIQYQQQPMPMNPGYSGGNPQQIDPNHTENVPHVQVSSEMDNAVTPSQFSQAEV